MQFKVLANLLREANSEPKVSSQPCEHPTARQQVQAALRLTSRQQPAFIPANQCRRFV